MKRMENTKEIKQMRILLINPGTKERIDYPHLGIGYIAAVLEKDGNQIEVLDMSVSDQKDLSKLLRSDFDLVGISATSFTFIRALDIIKKIKSLNKNVITVVGGPHTTIAMGDVLQQASIDFAVYGEGELTMVELIRLLKLHQNPNQHQLASIKGLIFRSNGDIVVNPPRPWMTDLDELPFPAFHLFKNMNRYQGYPILTSRGCPYHCIYCAASVIWGRRWRSRSVPNIIEEIKYAQANYNWHHNNFYIIDDSFNINVSRALKFCGQLIHKHIDITWNCQGIRADKMPLELAMKMKMAGCVGVGIGVESADQQVLKNIKKGENIEQISASIKNLDSAEISVHGSFMIGNPGDNLQTIKKSIEFVQKSSLFSVSFNTALPYPKTELWKFVQEHGHFLNDDYTKFHHFSQEPSFETVDFHRAERIKAYKMARRFYLIHRLKSYLRLAVIHLKWRELKEIGVRRVIKFMRNYFKIILDILMNRERKF